MKKFLLASILVIYIVSVLSTIFVNAIPVEYYGKWKRRPYASARKSSDSAHWYMRGVVDGGIGFWLFWWFVGTPNQFRFEITDTVSFSGNIKRAKACLFARNCKATMVVKAVVRKWGMTFIYPVFYICTNYYRCVTKPKVWLLNHRCYVTLVGEGYAYSPKTVIVSGSIYVERYYESKFEYEQISVAYAVNGNYALILMYNYSNRKSYKYIFMII